MNLISPVRIVSNAVLAFVRPVFNNIHFKKDEINIKRVSILMITPIDDEARRPYYLRELTDRDARTRSIEKHSRE